MSIEIVAIPRDKWEAVLSDARIARAWISRIQFTDCPDCGRPLETGHSQSCRFYKFMREDPAALPAKETKPEPHCKPETCGPAIDMILYCPRCGRRHIDRPDEEHGWSNPPHRSHLCGYCGAVWRPADVPTNGALTIKTRGKDDSPHMNTEGIKPDPKIATEPQDPFKEQLRRAVEEFHYYQNRPGGKPDIELARDRLLFAIAARLL